MQPFLPTSWTPDLSQLFPSDPVVARGPQLPRWIALLALTVVTTRSLIHIFLPDGGAGSIATIDTAVAGGNNIIALFGQWGGVQLLLAALLWLLVLRYPGLLALVLCVLLVEPLLRGLAGHLKPIATVGVAPGSALNYAFMPVLAVALYLSLCPARRRT